MARTSWKVLACIAAPLAPCRGATRNSPSAGARTDFVGREPGRGSDGGEREENERKYERELRVTAENGGLCVFNPPHFRKVRSYVWARKVNFDFAATWGALWGLGGGSHRWIGPFVPTSVCSGIDSSPRTAAFRGSFCETKQSEWILIRG